MINKKILNIGFVAHVDAGKTSLTEQLLYQSGMLSNSGSVDKGTSTTDWLDIEKKRGISIRAATASLNWNDHKINIIDTPGHVDFSSEVSRSLLAMDFIIIVVSAVEGVQGHTSNLWKTVNKLKKPYLFFINKCDREGADPEKVIESIKDEFDISTIEINKTEFVGTSQIQESNIISVDNIDTVQSSEDIINNDDELLEKFLNDEVIGKNELVESLSNQVDNNELIPVIYGSAKYGIGINTLLDFLSTFVSIPDRDTISESSGIIYKIEHHKKLGKIASVRLITGTLKNRDTILINGEENKVTQIKQMQGPVLRDVSILHPGDTAAVFGLSSAYAGTRFGTNDNTDSAIKLSSSVLKVKANPKNEEKFSDLVTALNELTNEDPELDMLFVKELGEINIKIMGVIQIQVLKAVIAERYNIEVEFDEPAVIYKESPKSKFTVVEEYTMPKPCWAVVRFAVEPLPVGSGVIYESVVGVNDIAIQYQQEVERNIPKALKQGIHGWEVTDIKITLTGDEDHNVHSRAGDFGVATHMALMKGFNEHGTEYLEPILNYNITAPEEFLGVIISSLTKLRATFDSRISDDCNCNIDGKIPVATSIDFPIKLANMTKGRGSFSTSFSGYEKCLPEYAISVPYRGVNPLDRSKFILKARNALI